MENWHRTYKHFNHNKALYVQTWYPFSTDHFEKKKKQKKPIQTLKHTYSFIHTETHENFSFWLHQHPCWEQYILLIQIYGPLSDLFPVRSGKKQFSCKQYDRYPLLYISQNLQNSQHPKYFESSGYKATLFFTLFCCVCKIAWKK